MKIGLITDIHYGLLRKFMGENRGDGSDALDRLPSLLESMKRQGVETIVNLGDNLSEQGRNSDRKRLGRLYDVFERSGIPTFYVLGNHECTTMHKDDAKLILRMPNYYYSVNFGTEKLVFLDAQDGSCPGEVDVFQMEWLKQELSNCNNAYVFVHQSLAEPDLSNNPWFRSGPSGGKIKNREDVRNILEDSGKVDVVVNGHLHQNRLQIINDISYLTVNSWSEFGILGKRDETYGILETPKNECYIPCFGKNEIHKDKTLIEYLSCLGC